MITHLRRDAILQLDPNAMFNCPQSMAVNTEYESEYRDSSLLDLVDLR